MRPHGRGTGPYCTQPAPSARNRLLGTAGRRLGRRWPAKGGRSRRCLGQGKRRPVLGWGRQSVTRLAGVLMASFVLIPGAGGAGWYWHRVVPLLRDAGQEATALDLPADDETAGLPEYARLAAEAAGGRDDV